MHSWEYITKKYDISHNLKSKNGNIQKIELPFNFFDIKNKVNKIIETYSIKPWNDEKEDWYTGIGLTKHPKHSDIFSSSLGISDDADETYYDSLSFTEFTPAGLELKPFLDKIPLQLIKSRIAIVNSNKWKSKAGWHYDEPLEMCIRVNIPITDSKNFGIQLDNQKPTYLETRYMYTWDTSDYHRVYVSNKSNEVRVNLVLGFSPWFYLKNNEWVPNQYFKKIHPLDIIDEIINNKLECS